MTFSERRDILAGLVEIFCQVEERNKRKNNNPSKMEGKQKTPLNKAFFAVSKSS
jgi:hypothetical protein